MDLAAYLNSMAAWTEDMDGYYAAKGQVPPEQPSWQAVADMLIGASMYE